MFEKEAEEYAEKKICQEFVYGGCMEFYKCREYCERYHNTQKYWKDGAEFGYNKANEEIEKLKEKLKDTEKARDYWKGSSFDWRHKCKSRKPFKVAKKAQKQLTKAKEIMQKLCDIVCGRSGYDWELLEQVEYFISEVEK